MAENENTWVPKEEDIKSIAGKIATELKTELIRPAHVCYCVCYCVACWCFCDVERTETPMMPGQPDTLKSIKDQLDEIQGDIRKIVSTLEK